MTVIFILLGPSKGTRQITDEGIKWLIKQGYSLLSEDKIELYRGDYRYLEDKGYLYIEDIDYDKHEIPETPLHDNEVEKEGPSLLLTLDKDHNSGLCPSG